MKLFQLSKHDFKGVGIAQMFLNVCKFKWGCCILFKLECSCL